MHKFFLILAMGFLASFAAHAKTPSDVKFCVPDNMISAFAYIANAQGYFRDEGVEVTFVPTTNAKLCIDALLAGNADILAGSDGPSSYIGFSNHSLKLIAQISVNSETSLFARRDKGIQQESDIRGKKIGYLPGTVSYLYLARLLEKTGLSFADIKAVAMQPPAMPQALQGGVIDGFVMWEPWGDQAMKALGNDKVVRLNDKALYSYKGILMIREDFSKQPDKVKAVLKALLRAESYVQAHSKESIAFLADIVKLDPTFLEKHWSDYELKIKFDHSLVPLMEENARLIIRDDENFKNKLVPNYSQTIDSSFLRAIAPERVAKGL
jgi:ABC-type nitrate/sulfonate/bicarbonate transport system substrate-binding protein